MYHVPRRRSSTTGVVAMVLVALTSAGAGCGRDGPGGGSPAAPSSSAVPAFVPGADASYAAAPCPSPNVPEVPELELGPEFSCGYLTVPENRTTPAGRKIKVAVARAKASSPHPRPDPLVYLTGGPGGTALATAPIFVKGGLNRERDVVFVDQRGTLHADPLLSCPEVDQFVAAATSVSVMAPTTQRRDVAAVRACRDRLAGAGYDLSAYNTTENAADLADLRVALGIDRWDVYGVSYGSDLALQLVRDHPQGIRSVVLDSLVPPKVNLINQFWPSAAEGYQSLFGACGAQPGCAAAYPNLSEEFTAAVNRLARQPLTVELPPAAAGAPARQVVIDGYTLANLVVLLSLSPGNYAGLPRLIHQVATGDGTAAATALLGTVSPPGLTGYGLTYGVFCREQAAYTDAATVTATAKRALPGFPDPVLSLPPQAPRLLDECPVWNVGTALPSVHDVTRSDLPVLLLAGTLDAVTPPSQAGAAAQGLTHSRVIRFPGLGHDVPRASACARSIVASFLDAPDHTDTTCLESVRVPDFATG